MDALRQQRSILLRAIVRESNFDDVPVTDLLPLLRLAHEEGVLVAAESIAKSICSTSERSELVGDARGPWRSGTCRVATLGPGLLIGAVSNRSLIWISRAQTTASGWIAQQAAHGSVP